jgi:hypothetical protein
VLGLAGDLRVGEAQRGEAGGCVHLVSEPIPSLLGRRSVITQPVGLDDQAQVGPVEVDAKAVYAALGQRRRQAYAADERQEAPLELAVSQAQGLAIEQRAQRGHPSLPDPAVKRGPQPLGIDEVEPVGFVDGRLELRL